jgi:hypothetical protein
MKQQEKINFKDTKVLKAASLSVVILASAFMGLTIGSPKNAYAVSCTLTYGTHCYAVHIFNPNFSVEGVRSTEKVLYTTGSAGWVENSNWVILYNSHFLEVGWHQNTVSGGGNPYFLWAADGVTQKTWGTPSDNTYYTFTAESLAENSVWNMSAGGQTYSSTLSTSFSNQLEVGYEFTYTSEINLRTNDYNPIQYGQQQLGWVDWNSADGTHSKYLQPGTGYFVQYCGTGNQQYYHSQHGQGTPTSC